MRRPEWLGLKYADSSNFLLEAEKVFDASGIKKYTNPTDILLNRRIRGMYEDWRCAIFCHGAGQALRKKIFFASFESADYDYVGAFEHEGNLVRFPIQMKQLVPSRLNYSTSLQSEVDKLKKYTDADDLVVAIHINRKMNLKLHEVNVSELRVKEIWLYGQLQRGGPNWLLAGNLMKRPNTYTFQLPAI